MDIKNGDVFKHSSDGLEFVVKKIMSNMAILESQDGKRQILTEVNTLKLKSFYLKKETSFAIKQDIQPPFHRP